MGSIVVVVGIPGVGKSSVIEYAVNKLKEDNIDVNIVNYGTIMLEEAVRRRWVSNRDEIRKLDVERQMELQMIAAKKINDLAEKYDVTILDTHLFIKTKRGRWPGLNINNLTHLKNIRQIVIIEAKPEEIYGRRSRDSTRYRADYGGINEIKEDLEYNRLLSTTISILTNSPVYVIENREGMLNEAGEMLYNILKEVISE